MGLTENQSWYLGVSMNLLGSITINLGTNLLKVAYVTEAADLVPDGPSPTVSPTPTPRESTSDMSSLRPNKHKQLPLLQRSATWFIGMFIFCVGNILNFVSFAFAAQSLLAALEPAFISNVIFGHFLLGEPVNKKVINSTLLILLGNIIVVVSSSHESKSYTTDDLLSLYSNPLYITYLILGAFVCVVLTVFERQLLLSLQSPTSTTQYKYRAVVNTMPSILYALVSGIIGTQSVIFAKALSNIVILSFRGDSQLKNPFSYFVLICWLGSMVFWLRRMNNALLIFPGNRIIPVLQVVWILFGVISGGIYYQEFTGLSASQCFGFVVGLTIVVVGVGFLAPGHENSQTTVEIKVGEEDSNDDDDNDDDEETPGIAVRTPRSYRSRLTAPALGTLHLESVFITEAGN